MVRGSQFRFARKWLWRGVTVRFLPVFGIRHFYPDSGVAEGSLAMERAAAFDRGTTGRTNEVKGPLLRLAARSNEGGLLPQRPAATADAKTATNPFCVCITSGRDGDDRSWDTAYDQLGEET
jgi:hypothetical protein